MSARFVGARLREARIARRLTAAALAEAVGVSRVALSRYETKSAQPKGEVLARLAEELRVPVAFFGAGEAPAAGEPIRYRSITAATKRARDSLEVRLGWLRVIHDYLLERLELRPPNLPELDFGEEPEAIGAEDIEAAAVALREAWGMKDGPIPNLTARVEGNGLVVSRFAFNSERLDALSQWTAGQGYILLGAEAPLARQRFNLAHELGHLVLHRSAPPPSVAGHKLMEQQAHRFAAAFLFPASAFLDEVLSVDPSVLLGLKRRWGMSKQAILYRARELKLISQRSYERHQRQLSRRGERSEEVGDRDSVPELPRLLRRCFAALIERGGYTPGDILRELALPELDIVQLAGLRRDFFSEEAERGGEVIQLRPRPPG